MKILDAIKKFKWGYLLIATLLCAMGIVFLVYPSESTDTLAYVLGGVTLVFGILIAVNTLSKRERGVMFALYMIAAISSMICGIVAMIAKDLVIGVFMNVIGLFIIIDGSFKLQTVINAKRFKMKMWWFLLSFSCLTIAFGFWLVKLHFDSEENFNLCTNILGIALFICGLGNFFSLFYFNRIQKKATEHILSEIDVNNGQNNTDIDTNDSVSADS